jgi:hypothetical protein
VPGWRCRARRQSKARPIADDRRACLIAQRQNLLDGLGLATAKAIIYSLKRLGPLTRYPANGTLPTDNDWIEKQSRLIALGRANGLVAGTFTAGQQRRR